MDANENKLVVRQLTALRTTLIAALEQCDAALMVQGISVVPTPATSGETQDDDEETIPTFGGARAPAGGGQNG